MIPKWQAVLSTTEPFNYIGIIKVRRGNVNSEKFRVQICENGLPYDLTGLKVYFQAMIGGFSIEESAEIIDAKNGVIEYTFSKYSMQKLHKQTANFEIRKNGEFVNSTQDFNYFVINAVSHTEGEQGSYWQSVQDLIDDMKEFINQNQGDFTEWFESVKDLLYGIDPGGKILQKLEEIFIQLNRFLPGKKFVVKIKHNGTIRRPKVDVLGYDYAIGTEQDGLGTAPSGAFGGGNIVMVPTVLEYSVDSVIIYMPVDFKLSGTIKLIDSKTLLLINGIHTLCFEIEGGAISGEIVDNLKGLLLAPKNLRAKIINETTIQLDWEKGSLLNG